MPVLQDSVFTIWNTIKNSALGVSDKYPNGYAGYAVSFFPTGFPIDKDEYFQPWEASNPGTKGSLDRLRNVCSYVDQLITIKEVAFCEVSGVRLSEKIYAIFGDAEPLAESPITDPTILAQVKAANDLLYSDTTITGHTILYDSFLNAVDRWNIAVKNYAAGYQAQRVNPDLEATWPDDGDVLDNKITVAYNDVKRYQLEINNALNIISSQSIDTATALLADAKRNTDIATSVENQNPFFKDVGSGERVLLSYVEPSSWCDPDADNWTEFYFDSATSNVSESSETTSYGGGGGVNFGFWSIGGKDKHVDSHHELNIDNDNIFVSFQYATAQINRPWLDTFLFDMGRWYLPHHKNGSISHGQYESFPGSQTDDATYWLSSIPSQLVLVKNLFVSNSKFTEAFNESKSHNEAGGSFGWGPFSISGSYSKDTDNVSLETYQGHVGLRVKGVQHIGYISDVVPYSPKIDDPNL